MTFDWQDMVALTVVLAAAAALARRVWRRLSSRRPIGGCTHCSSCDSGDGQKEFVSLESVKLTTLRGDGKA